MELTLAEAKCEAHPGRKCHECQATVYVDDPADVFLVCNRPMCPSYSPSYSPRAWPKWADSARWWELKRRAEKAEEERRQAQPIPQ